MAGSPADLGTAAVEDNPAAEGGLAGMLPAAGHTGHYLQVREGTVMKIHSCRGIQSNFKAILWNLNKKKENLKIGDANITFFLFIFLL